MKIFAVEQATFRVVTLRSFVLAAPHSRTAAALAAEAPQGIAALRATVADIAASATGILGKVVMLGKYMKSVG